MPGEHRYYIYLLTNKNDKVMYIGVTGNLERRVYEHKTGMIPGFTEKYNVNRLVYFEETNDVRVAIAREKEIKRWRREKKNNLVVAGNPEWKDLSDGWFEISPFGRDDKSGERPASRDDKSGVRPSSRDDKSGERPASRDDKSGVRPSSRDDKSVERPTSRDDKSVERPASEMTFVRDKRGTRNGLA